MESAPGGECDIKCANGVTNFVLAKEASYFLLLECSSSIVLLQHHRLVYPYELLHCIVCLVKKDIGLIRVE